MAGPYYVDPAAAGGATGADWTNAWTTLQTALDTAAGGEIIYCRGTQTITAQLDIDTAAPSNTTGWVRVIGCNASGAVDGTRFVVDANGNACHGISLAGPDMYWFENIEVKNCGATKHGWFFNTANSTGCVFINCSSHNNGGDGWCCANRDTCSTYIRCISYSNTLAGFSDVDLQSLLFACRIYSNTTCGINGLSGNAIGCLIYSNGTDGVYLVGYTARMFNCVVDANANRGIYVPGFTQNYAGSVIGCRVTNHSGAGDIGMNLNDQPLLVGYNYFENNTGVNLQGATILPSIIPAAGVSTTSNVEDQSNTNQGYVGSGDYNLRSDASLRRTAITLPAP